jgi:hypothetical protein
MTRGNLLVVTVLVLALVGMFFWTLSLQHQLEESTALDVSGGPGLSAGLDARIRQIESAQERTTAQVLENRTDLNRLEGAVSDLAAGQNAAAPASAGSAPEIPATPIADAGDAAIRAAVEKVIEEKEAADRRERNERMAEGWSRWLLRDIAATDDQKSNFVKVVAAYLDGRGTVMQKYAGEDGDQASRDAELKVLEDDRNAKLLGIFGSADYVKIEESLTRMNRMWGGRGNRGDRGDRGGGGGGRPRPGGGGGGR